MNKHIHYSYKRLVTVAIILSLLYNTIALVYLLLIQKIDLNTFTGIDKHEDQYVIIENVQESTPSVQKEKEKEWVNTYASPSHFGKNNEPEYIKQKTNETVHNTPKESINHEENLLPNNHSTIQTAIDPTIQELSKLTNKKVIQQQGPLSKKKNIVIQKESSNNQSTISTPFTLADLTRGFLENTDKNSGNHLITTIGKKGGTATEEQLIHERYGATLFWHVQNAHRMNQDKVPSFGTIPLKATVSLTLNKDGIFEKISVLRSSGDVRVDNWVLFLFKEASSSFPPVPKRIISDRYVMSIGCTVYPH